MSFDFTPYESHDKDGNVSSTVQVYRVTDDHNDENVVTTGGIQRIHTGDVLVQSPNPNFVDVFSGDTFDGLGYVDPSAASAVPAEESADAADETGSGTPLDTGE